ncbi:hypothetical protein KVR01_013157 [Diaporthe batatas]|uniref:uncharacterized protein n=1 Tax=Diaporthe batatas TaxID=748121 RepID=UPI001D040F8C|nr:uncharacterized protein KVR01_013157 [Diaporthe batatas]KAG8156935.1 hypothetical protein KVR01_013157 [Diaporthe batatas]
MSHRTSPLDTTSQIMSSTGAEPEDSKDKALEVLAIYLSDDELVDFSNFNMAGGAHGPEDRDRFMALTNMHQHALYQLGLAIMASEVGGEGALEVFSDMLAMTGEALRQLRQQQPEGQEEEGSPRVEEVVTINPHRHMQPQGDGPEVGGGGGSPETGLGRVESIGE